MGGAQKATIIAARQSPIISSNRRSHRVNMIFLNGRTKGIGNALSALLGDFFIWLFTASLRGLPIKVNDLDYLFGLTGVERRQPIACFR